MMLVLRYAIAKPGVRQLVDDNVDQSAVACQKSWGEEGEAGIFLRCPKSRLYRFLKKYQTYHASVRKRRWKYE